MVCAFQICKIIDAHFIECIFFLVDVRVENPLPVNGGVIAVVVVSIFIVLLFLVVVVLTVLLRCLRKGKGERYPRVGVCTYSMC